MRYYSNDYRDEVIASLNGLFSALDDSYTVAICNVPDSETEAMNDYKDSAIEAANQASGCISNLSTKIETVISQLNDFYQYVDATGGEIYSRAADIASMLIRTNSVVDEICDILNGVGDYSGYKASPDLLDIACLPLSEVEGDREAYWNDFYLDDDGLVDAAAVSSTFELVENGEDAILDIYAEFSINYLSREDCNAEMMESLTNANLAAGMVPSTDVTESGEIVPTPSPDSEIVTIDGTDYYVIYFPYESSETLEAYYNRVFQLSQERYCNSINEYGEPYNVENVNQYLDILRTFTMNHQECNIDYNVAVPTLIPVSEIDSTEINPYNIAENYDTPPYSGFVSISSCTVSGEGEHLIVRFDSPVDVIFFSRNFTIYSDEYDSITAPHTGAYPAYGEYTFIYPCEYFTVYSMSLEPSEDDTNKIIPTSEELETLRLILGDDIFEGISETATWGDYINAFANYVKSNPDAVIRFLKLDKVDYDAIMDGLGELSPGFDIFMYFYGKVKESYEYNMSLDQDAIDKMDDMAECLASICDNRQGGYVVLHNDSGFDGFEIAHNYYSTYASWTDESVNNALNLNGLGALEN